MERKLSKRHQQKQNSIQSRHKVLLVLDALMPNFCQFLVGYVFTFLPFPALTTASYKVKN